MEENNPAQLQQSVIEPQPVKKPLFSKTIIAVFIVVILLILLPAGAYLFLNSNKQVACTTEAKLCPDGSSVGRNGPKCEFTKCPTSKSTPTQIYKTPDWKNYFTMEYPSDWLVKPYAHPLDSTDFGYEYYSKDYKATGSGMLDEAISGSKLTVSIHQKANFTSYEDLKIFDLQHNYPKNVPIKEFNLDKTKCLYNDYFSKYISQCTTFYNGTYYIFSFNSKEQQYLFKQILSTFKFTDQTSQTDPIANWKTYTNPVWKISFKYPDSWLTTTNPGESGMIIESPNLILSDFSNLASGAFIYTPYSIGILNSWDNAFSNAAKQNAGVNDINSSIEIREAMHKNSKEFIAKIKYPQVKIIDNNNLNYTYLALISNLQDYRTNQEIFNKILASLQFMK